MPTKHRVSLFVDRGSQRWIVRDGDGNFWMLPMSETPWEDRQQYIPSEDEELEPVPGHYKYMLGLTF